MSNAHDGYGVSAETFEAIIRERKAVKNARAEEKRLEILNSICERKSQSGIDPLDQFPKEVWDVVLDKLEQPKDLSNVSQVHDVFSDLLERRKLRDILFPQVVGLPIQTDSNPPAVILPLARNLNMRSLSKSIRNGVDRWYEDNLLQHLRTGNNVYRYDEMRTICLSLTSPKLKELLKCFVDYGSEESNAKFFLLRSLRVILPQPYSRDTDEGQEKQRIQEKYVNFIHDVCSLLKVIGDQVWHFEYIVNRIELFEEGKTTAVPQIYDTLKEWVEHLPSLKWLKINVAGEWLNPEGRKGVSIASHITICPFPTLEHLERLDVEVNTKSILVYETLEAIFFANRHLKILHFNGRDNELLARLPVARIQQMDSLETLSIGSLLQFQTYFTWRLIRTLITPRWQLKQIQWNIGPESVEFTDVIHVLANFQTLEHVSLDFDELRITRDLEFLKLPNLTEFKLWFCPVFGFRSSCSRSVQFFLSLQFLLYCKKLKKFQWENNSSMLDHRRLRRLMTNRECHERMINFRGGYRNLNYSNVWDVFPDLETVKVCMDVSWDNRWMKTNFQRTDRDLPSDQYVSNMRSWHN